MSVALIVMIAMLVLLGSGYLGASAMCVMVLLIIFGAGLGAILLITFKMPQLALMGGPELPTTSKINAIANLLAPNPILKKPIW
jgi:hypothetical protein